MEPIKDTYGGLTIVGCGHDQAHRNRRARGLEFCAFCNGEASTTSGFRLPVKRLVFAPSELTLAI